MIIEMSSHPREDCQNAERVVVASVSVCPKHNQIEAWINGTHYGLDRPTAISLNLELTEALTEQMKRGGKP